MAPIRHFLTSTQQHQQQISVSEKISTSTIPRRVAGSLLLLVIVMEILAAIVLAIQSSSGRAGRMSYYTAFAFTLIQDVFIGIVVPSSLAWVGFELFREVIDLEPLLTAVVGSLWYGPDRVQKAISNLLNARKRGAILHAALSSYHRVATDTDIDGSKLKGPLKVVRRLRFAPWWSQLEQNGKTYWNGRVIGDLTIAKRQTNVENSLCNIVEGVESNRVIRLSDLQLRSLGREGVKMALTGSFSENDVRYWCAGLVADQARFRPSALEWVQPARYWKLILSGHEGERLKQSVLEHHKEWSDDEWKRLASVLGGIRGSGLKHLRNEKHGKWVD